MKKILLSCSAVLCLLVAEAQLFMNEFYVRPNPSSGHQEFFELFNASTIPENADCYTLVVYFRESPTVSGFYVIDIPNIVVPARGHLLASSQAPTFNYQVGPATADFSWNDYISRYVLTAGVLVENNAGAPYNDIFTKAGTGGGSVYAMFLFKNNALQDAFLGGSGSIDVPAFIEALGTLTHTAPACGGLTYNFATIDNEPDGLFANVVSEAGIDNGYMRIADGPCDINANWEKTSYPGEHTPGYANPRRRHDGSEVGNLTFTLECTDSLTISYDITGGPSFAFPVVVQLYLDKDGSQTLNPGDSLMDTHTDLSVSDGQWGFSKLSTQEEFLFVFDAVGNCFDSVARKNCPSGVVLPVTMKSFTAKRNRGLVSLQWTTATESENLGFYIQRILGNGTWQNVGFVRSSALNGNSSSELTYTYTDPNTFKGVSQYRLRQADINGRVSYSEVRAVMGELRTGKLLIYPNPASNGAAKLVFDGSGVRDVNIMDLNGRILRQWRSVSSDILEINGLNPGMYMIRVTDLQTGVLTSEKLIVSER